MQKLNFIAAAAATLSVFTAADAQESSLIAGYHNNFTGTSELTLTIFGEEGTTGTISNRDGFSLEFSIGGNGFFQTNLNLGDAVIATDGSVTSKAIRVDATNPISALALNREGFTTDLASLLTFDGLGTEYYAMGFEETLGGYPSQMSITAVEDGTEVTFTPSTALSGFAAGVEHTVTLNAGQSLGLSGQDVTGTHVLSSAPVAVFGGGECTQVPDGVAACDHIISQNFAVEDFATDFRVVQTPQAGADGDLLRVISATDANEVFLDGVSQGTINAGEFLTIDNVGNSHLTSTNPVMVGQFMRGITGSRTSGDPAFSVIPGTNQWLKAYSFAVPTTGDENQADFSENFLHVVIAETAVTTLVLNASAVETGDFSEREVLDGFVYGIIPIEGGVGTVTADEEFLAMISGLDSADSYLSTIATTFSEGASVTVTPTPTVVTVPILPSEVAASGLPFAMMQMLGAESMRDRRGARILGLATAGVGSDVVSQNGPVSWGNPLANGELWVTITGERVEPNTNEIELVDSFSFSNSGIRLGYDFGAMEFAAGSLVAGVFVEYNDGNGTIKSDGFSNMGIGTTAPGIGASLTWFGGAGDYADLSARYLSFDNDIDGIDKDQDGDGAIISLEYGRTFALTETWSVIPQAQISYATYSLDDVTGPMDEEIDFSDGERVQARIGADFVKNWANEYGGTNSLLIAVNYIDDLSFDGEFDVELGSLMSRSYDDDYSQRYAEVGFGGRVALNAYSELSGTVYVAEPLEGNGDTSVRAQLSLNFAW